MFLIATKSFLIQLKKNQNSDFSLQSVCTYIYKEINFNAFIIFVANKNQISF